MDASSAVFYRQGPTFYFGVPIKSPTPVITVLQAGRAIAALAVVLYHSAAYTAQAGGALDPLTTAILSRGYLGVDFFFVLSGFIIYHTNDGKTQNSGWAKRYLETRFVRVFIPYWPVGVAVALGYTLLPGLSASTREWGWFPTLSLLPSSVQPALIVAWTLQHEIIFYLVFLVAFSVRRPLAVMLLWLAAMVLAYVVYGKLSPVGDTMIGDTMIGAINIEFLFGMLVVILLGSSVSNRACIVGAVVLLAGYAVLGGQEQHRILFAAALALALVPVVRAENAKIIAAPAFLVMLGDASYAIYLVHNPFQALVVRAAPMSSVVSLIVLFIAGAALGIAYHFAFEKPAVRKVRALLQGWTKPRASR